MAKKNKLRRGKDMYEGKGRKLPNVLNKNQLIRLFSEIQETDVFMGCLIALFCGLRISEVCNLRKNGYVKTIGCWNHQPIE